MLVHLFLRGIVGSYQPLGSIGKETVELVEILVQESSQLNLKSMSTEQPLPLIKVPLATELQ